MSIKYDRKNVKLLSVLSYIGPLFIVGSLSVEKEEENVKFHSRRGLTLFVTIVILYIFSLIISILLSFAPALCEITTLLLNVGITVFWIILAIMGIISSIKVEKKELPFIGSIYYKAYNFIKNRKAE